ncbi:unnamed protein product [Trichogramma brassicae]|uniref:Uncharacterized protein n=1 Tax=Trichogramma brassicae TaxID=86971 RepID=A0A6H5J4S4_9HYME|nr:unnamed protein product [Trichogramma brassicae]
MLLKEPRINNSAKNIPGPYEIKRAEMAPSARLILIKLSARTRRSRRSQCRTT